MTKDELKSLITQFYYNLLEQLDTNGEISQQYVADYLHDSAMVIESMDSKNLEKYRQRSESIAIACRLIVEQGLNSYKKTNDKFLDLTEQQEATFEESKQNAFTDAENFSEKFSKFHANMYDEINRAKVVIENLNQKIKKLEENSQIDPLTKVYNRRNLNNYLNSLCKKGTIKQELYLFMLDIDNFKKINDTYGHIAGDKILVFLSNTLKKMLREEDKIFRYGGEEFVVILNRISLEGAQKIAQRILDVVGKNKLIYKEHNIRITVSIGITQFIDNDAPEELIERADKALYRSKQNGKNQINMEVK